MSNQNTTGQIIVPKDNKSRVHDEKFIETDCCEHCSRHIARIMKEHIFKKQCNSH